ncbi:MAG: hypothetical protein Kow0027_09630 [Saprospiraceae bacterium]
MANKLLNDLFDAKSCLTEAEIEGYVKGELSGEMRFRVENHLLDCPLCADAVEGFQLAGGTTNLPEFSELQKKWSGSGKGQEARPRVIRMVMRVAAIAVIVLAAYWGFFRQQSSAQLFETYYSAYQLDIPVNMRSVETPGALTPSLVEALQEYDSGHYETSLTRFQTALSEDPGNEIAIFYQSLAKIEVGDVEGSVEGLQRVAGGTGIYKDKASWYLSLTYLKLDEKEKAKELLQKVADGRGFKSAEASKLLKQLK